MKVTSQYPLIEGHRWNQVSLSFAIPFIRTVDVKGNLMIEYLIEYLIEYFDGNVHK